MFKKVPTGGITISREGGHTQHMAITDHLSPDVQAMILAKYSRDISPVLDRLPNSAESYADHVAKLGKYYRDWGHKSVGQLASTTIFFENVSILAAKVIEDHPLFNGQECSTRYIDCSNQPMVEPMILSVSGTEDQQIIAHFISSWQHAFQGFYTHALPIQLEHNRRLFPRDESTSETQWNNAINAYTFDQLRGWLPGGMCTNVAFTSTFDTINDHFGRMMMSPLHECQDIGVTTIQQLREQYPTAAIDLEKLSVRNHYLVHPSFHYSSSVSGTGIQVQSYQSTNTLADIIRARKPHQKFPLPVDMQVGRMSYSDTIDFAGYRDLHRHRNGLITFPRLTPELGMHEYYFESLAPELKSKAEYLLSSFSQLSTSLLESFDGAPIDELQYCVPIGFKISFTYQCEMSQAMYIGELRSQQTVHPTLRSVAQSWMCQLKICFPELSLAGIDLSPSLFSLLRGKQTLNVETK